MKDIAKALIYFIRIFLILIIIGFILPILVNQIFGLFIMKDYNGTPAENSTFVMSYSLFKEGFLYYLNKIIMQYLCT